MNKTKKEIEKLKAKIVPLKQKIADIEHEEIMSVQRPRLYKMIGYSLRSKNNDDSYKAYAKILDLVEDKNGTPWFILENVSLQSKCNPYLHLDNVAPYLNKEWWDAEVPLFNWERCSDEEFELFKASILSEFSSQKKMRSVIKKYK